MSNQSSNQQSPLVRIDLGEIQASKDVLNIREEAFLGHINLRGSSDNPEFMHAVESVLGLSLPVDFNTFVSNEALTILWYGPNEWLVLTAVGQEPDLIAQLKTALAGIFSAVTDVSGGNTVLEISGSKAKDLLVKGCPLDLHHSVFGVGQCAQTVLSKAGMTVYKTDSAPVFKIIIRRSFSDYLGTWIIDAAREFA